MLKLYRTICALLALCASGLPAAAAQDLPASAFARLPAMTGASLSPDGARLAFVTHDGPARYLVITDLATGAQQAADFSTMRAYSTFWADEDTLIATVGRTRPYGLVTGDVDFKAFVTVNADTLEAEQLLREGRDLGFNFNTAALAGRDPATGDLLMPLFDSRGIRNLYAVDPENGRRMTRVARGTEFAPSWFVSGDGASTVRVGFNNSLNLFQIELREGSGWRTLFEARQRLVDMGVEGFTPDNAALVVRRIGDGAGRTAVLQRLDLADGSWGEVLYQDDRYDPGEVRLDPHRSTVVGVSVTEERTRTVWFDPELSALQANLDQSFAGASVTITAWTPDRSKFLISVSQGDSPPAYHLVDLASWNVTPLRASYPELYGQPLTPRQPVQFTARDGATIPAYLARPAGDGPAPYVLLVHGGPASRDYDGFDVIAHFLASRGYGVMQPQFRGSSGFGEDWEEAGYGQWGRGVMQHDLSDAVAWLRDQGLADRVCIAGASYGGYAALAGAAFTPDLYACAIAMNALSDAAAIVRYSRDRYGRESQTLRYWNQHFSGVVDGVATDAQLHAISPVRHVDAIAAPILLLHSRDDTVVPEEHSVAMNRALRQADKSVTFIRLEGGDHGLEDYQSRLTVLEAMADFLDAALAPAARSAPSATPTPDATGE